MAVGVEELAPPPSPPGVVGTVVRTVKSNKGLVKDLHREVRPRSTRRPPLGACADLSEWRASMPHDRSTRRSSPRSSGRSTTKKVLRRRRHAVSSYSQQNILLLHSKSL
jgi:hypothetical protein